MRAYRIYNGVMILLALGLYLAGQRSLAIGIAAGLIAGRIL